MKTTKLIYYRFCDDFADFLWRYDDDCHFYEKHGRELSLPVFKKKYLAIEWFIKKAGDDYWKILLASNDCEEFENWDDYVKWQYGEESDCYVTPMEELEMTIEKETVYMVVKNDD